MKKYIEAEAFKEWIENWFYKHKSYHPYAKTNTIPITELYDILEQMPAADVAEVRHGKWVFKFYCGNMSGYDYGMTCSVCGKPTHRQFAEKMPPYCPNCGSRMDLEGGAE